MIEKIKEKYLNKIISLSDSLKIAEKKIKTISFLRLFIALAGILSFYFALTKSTDFFYLLLLLIVAFSILAFFHIRLFRKRALLLNTIQINKNELKYLEHDYSTFDDGKEFIDFNHSYSYDLDLFGAASLFQSISRTVTFQGKIFLAESLTKPTLSEPEIQSKQESIQELKDKLDFRQMFQSTGMLLEESLSERQQIKSWLIEKYNFVHQRFLSYLLYILPSIAFVFLIISIYQGEMHPVLSVTILINWLIYGFNAKKINGLFQLVSKKKNLLNNYSDILKISHEENFNTPELIRIKNSHEKASLEFKRLANYVGWFDQRLNILLSPVLNTLFLFDLQCCIRIEKWKLKNEKDVLPWLDSLGQMDVFCCYGNFAYNNPDYVLPDFSKEDLVLKTEAISHPLIKRKKRVANNFSLGIDNHIAIITGANMAGKSTFLRTIGINMVLAFTGAPVCARQFKTSLVDIISSMRISDSLKDDVSYFYAELQRLKTIREKVEAGKPILILLDEMLRGTNSKDKQQGSKSFVENLLNFNCLSLVATHDLLLGKLEEEFPSKIKNYSFESFLKENELLFDYQIREGIANNTNASFLMKSLGII